MHPSLAVGLVFAGCCSNVVFLELLIREFPGSGNLITFSQFFFIALEGFVFEANFGRKQPTIPIRYAVSKYISIALVSLGIFTCTLMSAKELSSVSGSSEDEDSISAFLWWLLGIAALTFALLMSALMGIFQETIYKNTPFLFRGFSFWLQIFTGMDFSSVKPCTSLTVTLVVTLRKFVSLIFSILYFQNSFTAWHWLGTFLVFVGMLLYTEVWKNLGFARPCGSQKAEKKKQE
ncbi:putative UDP-xylose and UDP-N-acetylglucosamine transporter-like protein [Naja naja]|nr:putative UDP-xylose and UDP-N-acetylglucosamine transporter-like protein [Naja naja]